MRSGNSGVCPRLRRGVVGVLGSLPVAGLGVGFVSGQDGSAWSGLVGLGKPRWVGGRCSGIFSDRGFGGVGCIWSGRVWAFDVVRCCSAVFGGVRWAEVGSGRCAVLGEIPAAGRGYDGSCGRGYDGSVGAGTTDLVGAGTTRLGRLRALPLLELAARQARLRDDLSQRAASHRLVQRYRHGGCGIAVAPLHDRVAAAASNFREPVLSENGADLAAGENPQPSQRRLRGASRRTRR